MQAGPALLLRAALTGVVLAAAYLLALGYRTDYVGHFLAGYGGTLGVLSVVLAVRGAPPGWTGVLGVLGCIALGGLLELSIFRIAIFDPVDFVNQSLGAVLAGAVVVGRAVRPPAARGLLGLSVLFLALGFVYAFA